MLPNILNRKIDTQKLFGITMFINYIVYFYVFDYSSQYFQISLVLRIIACILCFSLLFWKYDENIFKKRLYWQIILTYCLPFFFTFMSLIGKLSIIWLMNSVSAIFFMIILLELKTFIRLFIVGILSAFILYKYICGYSIEFNPGTVSLKDIIATYFAVIVLGSLFTFSRDSLMKERKKNSDQLRKINSSLEQKVQEHTLELERALAAKTEFLNNMSHEIRTPVQGFMGISESLDLNWHLYEDSQKHKYTHEIAKNAKRLTSLMGSLLDLAKFNEGKLLLDIDSFDLNASIDDIIDEAQTLYYKDKNIQITFDRLEGQTSIMGDLERISQVLRNLLVNAIKFSPSESLIKIRLITTNIINDDGNKLPGVHFSIADQGVGIPKDELTNIFDSFTQSSRTKTRAGGTGLGLAICKEIIKAHHGKIWAQNKNGSGAIFHFIIPKIQEQPINSHKVAKKEQKALNSQVKPRAKINTVLIVDDEESMLAFMEIILNSANYKVIKANGGIEALKLIKANYKKIDLIFLDLMMPDMYGINVLKAIKQDKKMKNIPIIIQSGTSELKEKQRCFEFGATAFIAKPYTRKEILEEIDKLNNL